MISREKGITTFINRGKELLNRVSNIFTSKKVESQRLYNIDSKTTEEIISLIASLPKTIVLDQIIKLLNNVNRKNLRNFAFISSLSLLFAACSSTASNGSDIGIPGNGITETATEETEPTIEGEEQSYIEIIPTLTQAATETEAAKTPEPTIPNYLEMYKIDETVFENLNLQAIVELIQSVVGYEEGQTLHIDENSQFIQLDNQDNNTVAIFDLEGNLLATLEEAQTTASKLKLAKPNDLGFDIDGNITADIVDNEGLPIKLLVLIPSNGDSEKQEWQIVIPQQAIDVIQRAMGDKYETDNLSIVDNQVLDSNGLVLCKLVNVEGKETWVFATIERMEQYSNNFFEEDPSNPIFGAELSAYYGEEKPNEVLKTLKLTLDDPDFVRSQGWFKDMKTDGIKVFNTTTRTVEDITDYKNLEFEIRIIDKDNLPKSDTFLIMNGDKMVEVTLEELLTNNREAGYSNIYTALSGNVKIVFLRDPQNINKVNILMYITKEKFPDTPSGYTALFMNAYFALHTMTQLDNISNQEQTTIQKALDEAFGDKDNILRQNFNSNFTKAYWQFRND